MAEHGRRRRQLVVVASPLQGHMTPMLQLATFLHSKGFSITFAHSELNPPNPCNHSDFVFLPLPDNLFGTNVSADLIHFLQALNDNCKPHFKEHLMQMMNAQKETYGKESVVIIYDNLMFFAGFVAGELTGSAVDYLAHQQCGFLSCFQDYHPSALSTRSISCSSFLKEDMSCISWLDKQSPKSVIYVSLGRVATMDEKASVEMAWGLAKSNQPFLWVVRPGSVRGYDWTEFLQEDLMDDMKERGLIVKWAPQAKVLAHPVIGGFWSHCGWNSTLESVSEGVPMLCQPFGMDQMLNARYLSYIWKMGFEIVVERGEIEGGIRRILVDEEGEEMRRRATEIKENVKNAVCHGGSSHKFLEDLVEFILYL